MSDALIFRRPYDGLKLRLAALRPTRASAAFALPAAALFAAIVAAAQVLDLPPSTIAADGALPAPPSMEVRKLAPTQALAVNKEIPIAGGPNPAAAAFLFKGGDEARAQAVECLASAVYYEAGNEGADGERAVAQVILNRVRHPAFPSTVCGVVYQGSTRATGCQFTFTCDGSLSRRPDLAGWARARRIAEAALNGEVYKPVGWATHYHADYVVPYWASTLAKNAVVGAHLFYRWAAGWGRPGAFVQRYSGGEASASALRNAALAAEAATARLSQPSDVAAAIEDIPGAEVIKLTPSMRGDKRVAVRFNQTARKAADQAERKPYVENFKVSDNLRWTLSSDTAQSGEKPLGTPAPATAAGTPAPAPQP